LLLNFGHPEIAIFGLPLERMHAIINLIGDRIEIGERFDAGSSSTGILQGYTCEFGSVRKVWYAPFFGRAMWLYRGDDFPIVQCLWPDRGGHTPRDPTCDEAIRALQPLLECETEEAARTSSFMHWTRTDG
jgi:hypothetical protein